MEHYCGVVGAIASNTTPASCALNIPHIIFKAVSGLQHRGQESAGIVTSYGGVNANDLYECKGRGLVQDIFTEQELSRLEGNLGVGHTRYSTQGQNRPSSCQPFVVDTIYGLLAVAHNGELVNAQSLRKDVLSRGVGLSSFSDSELITQSLCLSPPTDPDQWPSRIQCFMEACPASYSLVIMHADKIYAVRDPYGNRPLSLGQLYRLENESVDRDAPPLGWVVSSESCSFFSIGAELLREVLPGEIVEISRAGYRSLAIVPRQAINADKVLWTRHSSEQETTNGTTCTSSNSLVKIHSEANGQENREKQEIGDKDTPPAFCIFEYVYFAKSDSYFEGQSVYGVRYRSGVILAEESPVEADIVSVIPESAVPAALGYSEKSGIPYAEVLSKNRYVGRSFIQPNTRMRTLAVSRKFAPLIENIRGRRIIVIDDSIVRGTTIQPIVSLLNTHGATEVHIRVASPAIKHACYMGINIPTRDELIANRVDIEKLPQYLGATSIKYLTIEGLQRAVNQNIQTESPTGHCTACLTGKYPIKLDW